MHAGRVCRSPKRGFVEAIPSDKDLIPLLGWLAYIRINGMFVRGASAFRRDGWFLDQIRKARSDRRVISVLKVFDRVEGGGSISARAREQRGHLKSGQTNAHGNRGWLSAVRTEAEDRLNYRFRDFGHISRVSGILALAREPRFTGGLLTPEGVVS